MRRLLSLTFLTTILMLGACGDLEQETAAGQKESEKEEQNTSESISYESEPLEIARKLVEQEMSKQIGLKEWEITENIMTSDNTIDNIADYDKPVGEMRIVWVTGNVKATADAEEGGGTGNFGYDLELYQMKDDPTWYIGKHYGVLIDLEVTDKPDVDESGLALSDSDELPFSNASEDETGAGTNEPVEDDLETEEYYDGLIQQYVDSINQHFNDIGLMKYIEGEQVNVGDMDVFEVPGDPSWREYSLYLENVLTDDFNTLSESEQFDLLAKLSFGEYEFFDGNQFDVVSLNLTSGSDTYTITWNTLDKNGERFVP